MTCLVFAIVIAELVIAGAMLSLFVRVRDLERRVILLEHEAKGG